MSVKRIIISVSIAFFICFLPLVVIEHFHSYQITQEKKDQNFFMQVPDPKIKKIYLLGASHVGQLNVTLINEHISTYDPKYAVYNLAYAKDSPSMRVAESKYLISSQPTIVFYGISYRDFVSETSNQYPLPDLKEYFDKVFSFNGLVSETINPQLITLEAIRTTFNIPTIFPPEKKITNPNTPFYFIPLWMTVITDESRLKKDADSYCKIIEIGSATNNKELTSLKEMIDELQKNKIKVVIFTTPLQRDCLQNLSDSTKENFSMILKDISNQYGIKIYDYTEKYEDLPIWFDPAHVSYNSKSMIFSKDVAKMIFGEINN